jgi:hypothetical protein
VTQQPQTANLTISPSVGAFLTSAGVCPPSGPAQLAVDFPSGASTSPPLLFCTNGAAGSYTLTSTSVTDPSVGSVQATVTAAPQPGSVSLTRGADGGAFATLLDCSGSPIVASGLSITYLDGGALGSGLAFTDDAGRVAFSSPTGSLPSSVYVTVASTGQTCTGTLQ